MNAADTKTVTPTRLVSALALPVLVLVLEFQFWDHLRPYVWLPLFPAVFVAALVGGIWGGIGATAITAVLLWAYYIPAYLAQLPFDAAIWPPMIVFASSGLLFSVAGDRLGQKKLQVATHAANSRHRRLFDHSPAGIVYLDGTGRICDANPAYCSLTGYAREELLEMHAEALIDPIESERLQQYLADPAGTAGNASRWRMRRKGGIAITVEASIFREVDGGTLAIVGDIGDRLRYEEQLRDAHARNQAVLDSVTAQLAVIDHQGIIVATNESWRLFAHRHCANSRQLAGTEVGTNFLDVCRSGDEDDNWAYTGVLEVLLGRTDRFRGECRCDISESETLWFAMTVTPVAYPVGGAAVAYHDISDIHRARDSEHEALVQMKTLAARQLVFQEEERLALSRELHDHVGQDLGALELALDQCTRHAGAAKAQSALWEARLIVKGILEATRDISRRLRPPLLDDLGLAAAVRWHIDKLPRADVLGITFEDRIGNARFRPDVELAAFRIAQEALTNALRHSGARKIRVRLEMLDAGLGVSVRDDGVGFSAAEALERSRRLNSLGLIGMRERAANLGGQLRIESRPGAGTEVSTLFYGPPTLQ